MDKCPKNPLDPVMMKLMVMVLVRSQVLKDCGLQVMSRRAAFESTEEGRSSMTHSSLILMFRVDRNKNARIFVNIELGNIR